MPDFPKKKQGKKKGRKKPETRFDRIIKEAQNDLTCWNLPEKDERSKK